MLVVSLNSFSSSSIIGVSRRLFLDGGSPLEAVVGLGAGLVLAGPFTVDQGDSLMEGGLLIGRSGVVIFD